MNDREEPAGGVSRDRNDCRSLRRERDRLLEILNSIEDGIYVSNQSYEIEFINPILVKEFGPVGGRKCYEYFHDRRGKCPWCVARDAATARTIRWEWFSSKTEKFYDLVDIPIRNEDGSISKLEIFRDITNRRTAEEALRRSEERYAVAQRAANIGSWDWDITTGDLVWSEKIEPMFGFEPGGFGATYEAFLESVHPEDRDHVVNSVNACVDDGKGYDIEHRIIWPDGMVRWVSETGNVIRDSKGRAIRMLGVVRDITRRKEAEAVLRRDKETFERLVKERTDELFKTQRELEKAARLSDIGALAAMVAHELRNPLGVIRTAAFNIGRKRQNPSIDKHLVNIEKKISESDQIINNLLSYSRIKLPAYEAVAIGDLIEECITSAMKRYRDFRVSVNRRISPVRDVIVDADPFQVGEVLNNILNNAFQALPERKGRIDVAAGTDSAGTLSISITDDGSGIESEDLERVFEPFFTRRSKGTGLGLSICNELVSLHGGGIDIRSERGEGTTVTVHLPIGRGE